MASKKKRRENAIYGSTEQLSANNTKKARFAVVEAYKTIRTNLQFLMAQNDGKVISLLSAGAGEGKSTTTLNIAITFAQLGGKVLLVDADLRRSSIHKKLKLDNKDGLSNVLVGFSELETAVHSINDSLDVLTGGPLPPNPSELLGSKHFTEFVEKCREKYDYIFIDTPPINVVADALVIAPSTDGIVLVIRDAITPFDAFNHAVEAAKFANINILGTVMNGVNNKRSRRYSYRKYAYGYSRYGYSRYGYGRYGYNRYGYGGYSGYGYGGYGDYGNYYGGYDQTEPVKNEKTSSEE